MSNTKIIIALVAVAALALVVVGLVSAQVVINQTIPGATPSNAVPNSGDFFGWIGRCLGFRDAQQYYGTTPYIAPEVPPTNTTAPNPYLNPPVEGYYGYGCGCWGRFIP
jgi:hypothetical protein